MDPEPGEDVEVAMAAIADGANVSRQGKLNILGIFDTIGAAQFPIVHPTLTLTFRLLVEFEDQQRRHHIEVGLIDEDNRSLWNASANVDVGEIAPGEFQHINQVINLRGIRFERPGRYRFRIKIDGREPPYDLAFQIVQGKPRAAEPPA